MLVLPKTFVPGRSHVFVYFFLDWRFFFYLSPSAIRNAASMKYLQTAFHQERNGQHAFIAPKNRLGYYGLRIAQDTLQPRSISRPA